MKKKLRKKPDNFPERFPFLFFLFFFSGHESAQKKKCDAVIGNFYPV
jgi:hypothetical protein